LPLTLPRGNFDHPLVGEKWSVSHYDVTAVDEPDRSRPNLGSVAPQLRRLRITRGPQSRERVIEGVRPKLEIIVVEFLREATDAGVDAP
jgi:hypothetical protein